MSEERRLVLYATEAAAAAITKRKDVCVERDDECYTPDKRMQEYAVFVQTPLEESPWTVADLLAAVKTLRGEWGVIHKVTVPRLDEKRRSIR